MGQRDITEEEPQSASEHLGLALRGLQNRIAATGAPGDLAHQAAVAIDQINAQLDAHRYVAERDRTWADRDRAPGSRTLHPEYRDLVVTSDRLDATVEFGAFYLGVNGATHGGALTLLFDDVFGELANHDGGPYRTAYLRVDYRNVAPLQVDLAVHARVDSIDGRKRFLVAELHHGDVLVAEAQALFVAVRTTAN
ncbi:MAG: PaaI family thioesterase [Candidatus Nanopelagicales bacterium]